MKNEDQDLPAAPPAGGLPQSDKVWTWDGYTLKSRMRKHVDKEIRDAAKALERGVHYRKPDAVFESELEAVAFVVPIKLREVDMARKNLKSAESILKRWHLRYFLAQGAGPRAAAGKYVVLDLR